MIREVVLTPLAEINYEKIIQYLINNWGAKTTTNFIARFEKMTELIIDNPEIFPYVNKEKRVQKCVLTKHNILYFKQTPTAIKILTIFDTRQNPDKLSFIF